MAASSDAYRTQVDLKRIQEIREICRGLPTACSDFLRHIAVTTGSFTRLAYAIDLRTFFEFLHTERARFAAKELPLLDDTDLAALAAQDLIAYTEYLTYYLKAGAEDASAEKIDESRVLVNHDLAIKRKLCSIRAFYDYLFQAQRIPSNVTLLVPLPKIHEKPILRLSADEMERILSTAQTGEGLTSMQQKRLEHSKARDYAILSVFLGTGIRVSECVGLNLSDIDLEEKAFLVTRKGGNQVILYFPDDVIAALKPYLEERNKITTLPGHEDALFLSQQKRRITQRAVQNLVKKYAAVAAPLKPRISPHKLRSTFATNLYQQTGDIYLVADVLGHSSVDTTRKHYADMTDARRRMASEIVHLPEPAAGLPESDTDSSTKSSRRNGKKQAENVAPEDAAATHEENQPPVRRSRRAALHQSEKAADEYAEPAEQKESGDVSTHRRRRAARLEELSADKPKDANDIPASEMNRPRRRRRIQSEI